MNWDVLMIWPVATIILLIALSPFLAAVARTLRAEHRQNNGHCTSCNYNLTGNVSGVCPECGTKI